jgi:hypothetical protein
LLHQVGEARALFNEFGFKRTSKALRLKYRAAPENWRKIAILEEASVRVVYNAGPLGLCIQPVDLIPGVQRGILVTSVVAGTQSEELGIKAGDVFWCVNRQPFNQVNCRLSFSQHYASTVEFHLCVLTLKAICRSTDTFANAISSLPRPLSMSVYDSILNA